MLGFGDQVTGSVRVVKTAEGPVQEPPLAVKVETKGTLDDLAKCALKEEIESEIARRLRFKANVQLFDEGDLPVIYGATGKAKILETKLT